MATASQLQALAALKGFLTTGEYSDLTVTCGEDTYKVHKLVVCGKSNFFPRVVSLVASQLTTCEETQRGTIDLPEDEPEVIKLLVQFLYEGEYDPPLHSVHAPNLSPVARLQFDPDGRRSLTHVYEVADKYGVLGLKDVAKGKFRRACLRFWSSPSFALAARHAFSTTHEDDKDLRAVVSETVTNHMELVKEPSVNELLGESNGLAQGILEAVIREHGWGQKK